MNKLPDERMRGLAAKSMFAAFAGTAMGSMLVDRQHRIVWISDSCKQFLPAPGFDSAEAFVGKRVEEVVPNTLMNEVIDSGQPIPVDLLSNQAGTFLVSRLPLRDDSGQVIGAFGMVLLDQPETTVQPLMTKFARLQRELDTARQQLAAQRRPNTASPASSAAARRRWRSNARRGASRRPIRRCCCSARPARRWRCRASCCACCRSRRSSRSNQVQRIDVRVIAATSRDLAAMVAAGSFRADLYQRLNVLPIRLPPLRARPDDLESLVVTLAEDISRRSGLPHKSLNTDALDLLARHHWPGNIRELRNVLEQATLMTDDTSLGAAHFASLLGVPARAEEAARSTPVASVGDAPWTPLPQAVAELEARCIRQALQRTGGNKLAAARLLGISRATLYQKLPSTTHNAATPAVGD